MFIEIYRKINYLALIIVFSSIIVFASLSQLTWNLGIVVSTEGNAQDAHDFFMTNRGYANNILSQNQANVTIGLPNPIPQLQTTHIPSLPDIVYLGGPNDNSSQFSTYSSNSVDNVVIVQEIMVYNSGAGVYENNAGATVVYGSDPSKPDLSFIATDIGNGNPPAQTVFLHELIHRSGHVFPRVSDPGGHTVDGNVMRAGPRNQDTDLTSTQKTNIRNHIQYGDYYPQ